MATQLCQRTMHNDARVVLGNAEGLCHLLEGLVLEEAEMKRRLLPWCERTEGERQFRIIGSLLHLVERIRWRRRPESQTRPSRTPSSLVTRQIEDCAIEPAFEGFRLGGSLGRRPDPSEGFLKEILGDRPIVGQAHSKSKRIVAEEEDQWLEPGSINWMQGALPIGFAGANA